MEYAVSGNKLQRQGIDVSFVESPNVGGQVKQLYLIIHYTAGTTGAGAISWLGNRDSKASAHFVIDRNGDVTQMVALNRIAWHAGRSHWQGIEGLNAYSIGIEIVNAGQLKKTESGNWKNWASNTINDDEVTVLKHKHGTELSGWHAYTHEQLESVAAVGAALHQRFKFLDVLGHEDISPGRKIDPGPACPMISLSSKILGRQ